MWIVGCHTDPLSNHPGNKMSKFPNYRIRNLQPIKRLNHGLGSYHSLTLQQFEIDLNN